MNSKCIDAKNNFAAAATFTSVSRGHVGGILFQSEKVAASISKR